MVYRKEYYEKNKEKFREWARNYQKKNRDKVNEYKRKWRHGKGKEKNRISKQKTDHKYYHSHKDEPEFHRKMIESSRRYFKNNREKHNELVRKRSQRPEVKERKTLTDKKWRENNPDKLLQNTKNHLTRIGFFNDLKWWQVVDQLKGWSKIIHEDNNQKCAICGNDSTQAHHILHKSKYPQLAFNRNNGIALCEKCHYEIHGKTLILRGI